MNTRTRRPTRRPTRRAVALGTLTAGLLLVVAAPGPTAAVQQLREVGSATDQTAPLVALLALLAWGLTTWLALTVALTAGGHLPGLTGRAFAAAARRIAPTAVCRAVEVTLGLTVALGMCGAPPAVAAPGAPVAPRAPAVPDAAPDALGGPGVVPAAVPGVSLDWGAATAAGPVVVRPGDSLWRLAAQDLRRRGGAAPSNAEIAQAWPSWWAANREAVGDDPDVIQPGTRLTPPPASP
ncbi:MAG: LysM domain-containing protein [Mycobacteriales bacterium]